jgi:hypothetical protein
MHLHFNNFTYRNIDQMKGKTLVILFFSFTFCILVEIHFVVILTKNCDFETKKFKINLIIRINLFRYIKF